MIKKIILGILLGIVLLYLFIYFGGSDYLKSFGSRTEQAGQDLKQYEKKVRETTKQVEKSIEKAADTVKEKLP